MTENRIKIEVDGREIDAAPGEMLIEATDRAGIYVPRFCYHKHLTVAANCRMCLVEVEKAPKTLPACATPVSEGMKVSTQSEKAVSSQHATMEFLLINHPLDCPICDQGGECELQDLAMGYGSDISRFTERKRVVRDKNIGPLVQTDMTRCIHCTRCVRFGEEIAGLRELGATGRGEHMEIGTYVEKTMNSELSGNVIDLCPVGALTSKPYRFSARAWELQQKEGIAPHDGLGSNLYFHTKGGVVKRVVPRENSSLNQVWLSDRDRYSYEGINHPLRIENPRIKKNDRWVECDWDSALSFVQEGLQKAKSKGNEQVAALVSANATLEEHFYVQRLVRGLGSGRIDYRLRQQDFSYEKKKDCDPFMPDFVNVEESDAILLVGAYPRHEQPLLNLRLRKAALKGSVVMTLDSHAREFNFATQERVLVHPSQFAAVLADLVELVGRQTQDVIAKDSGLLTAQGILDRIDLGEVASVLSEAERPLVVFGAGVEQHQQRSILVNLVQGLADSLSADLMSLSSGANARGAWLLDSALNDDEGAHLKGQWKSPAAIAERTPELVMLLDVDPLLDCARSASLISSLRKVPRVVSLSGFENDTVNSLADVILPIAVYAENEGTFVNLSGEWQGFDAAIPPLGSVRPAWKILRMLGSALSIPGFEAVNYRAITTEIEKVTEKLVNRDADITEPRNVEMGVHNSSSPSSLEVIVEVPIYRTDALVRNASALQKTFGSGDDFLRITTSSAVKAGLSSGDLVSIVAEGRSASAEIQIDDSLAQGVCLIYGGREKLSSVAVDGATALLTRVVGDAVP